MQWIAFSKYFEDSEIEKAERWGQRITLDQFWAGMHDERGENRQHGAS
jgi:hypothetical protein